MDPWKQTPAAAPLMGLQELLDWSPGTHPFRDLLTATVKLSQADRERSQPQRPRLLVCHDQHGNYHSDALPQGNSNSGYYRLTQWSSIDVFVYFSHSLVTIPPPGWINAAHTNGVPVLGTFITEWEAGSILCELLLWTEQSAEAAALQLANIAAFYGFDGWLLNIENPVLHRLIPNLVHFIRVLRKLMREMVPGSQVIWYDAVTAEGILQWQDTLNHLNMPFFEAADAIFINYTWKEGTPHQAAAVAGARKHDVYMGVDVFGRNTYGLSAALFAPAWVWEVGNRADWLHRQQEFWECIQACWEQPRALVCHLPFSTCFDQGAGQARFSEGDLVLSQPWFNLSCQSPQPSLRRPTTSYDAFKNKFLETNTAEVQPPLSASLCTELAFQLGSCLKVQGAVKPGTSSSVEIFTADLLIPQPGLRVAFTFKPTMPASLISLELWCWMEPSISSSGGAPTDGGSAAVVADNVATDGVVSESESMTESQARVGEARVRVLAMLQANGAVIVTDEQAPGCTGRQLSSQVAELDVQETVHHNSGWLTLYYRLPSHLPDFSLLTLRSLEVAAVAPANPPVNAPASLEGPCSALGYVGSIALTEWDQVIQEPQVLSISFADITWTAPIPEESAASHSLPSAGQGSSAAAPGGAGDLAYQHENLAKAEAAGKDTSTMPSAIWLYATLNFPAKTCEAASRFEVFYQIDLGAPGSEIVRLAANADTAGWVWLGTTVVSQFRVTQMEVPVSATSVHFAVQVADMLGKLTPFESVTFATLPRP